MVSNDNFDGKATNLNYFYLHINFEQKYLKPAIVYRPRVFSPASIWHCGTERVFLLCSFLNFAGRIQSLGIPL